MLRGERRRHSHQFLVVVCVERKSLACIFFWNLLSCLHLCCILSRGLLLSCVQRSSILLTGTESLCVWVDPASLASRHCHRIYQPYVHLHLYSMSFAVMYSVAVVSQGLVSITNVSILALCVNPLMNLVLVCKKPENAIFL